VPRTIHYPITPDGRYFIVRGRLWRLSNPALPETERARLMKVLAQARSALRRKIATTPAHREAARKQVHAAKVDLGERGAVWWTDGSPDFNRHMVANTPYRSWHEQLSADNSTEQPGKRGITYTFRGKE